MIQLLGKVCVWVVWGGVADSKNLDQLWELDQKSSTHNSIMSIESIIEKIPKIGYNAIAAIAYQNIMPGIQIFNERHNYC